MEPFTVLVGDCSRISQEKNPSGIAGNGVSTTCYTPRNGVREVAPPRFLRRFLIFYFSKSCCIRFQTRPRLCCRQYSIYIGSGDLQKAVFLEYRRKCLLLCVEIITLIGRILRLLYSLSSQIFSLVQVLCEVEVETYSSCRLKLDVLHSSALESFPLGMVITFHDNASLSLGCPIYIENNNISYNLLAAQSLSTIRSTHMFHWWFL